MGRNHRGGLADSAARLSAYRASSRARTARPRASRRGAAWAVTAARTRLSGSRGTGPNHSRLGRSAVGQPRRRPHPFPPARTPNHPPLPAAVAAASPPIPRPPPPRGLARWIPLSPGAKYSTVPHQVTFGCAVTPTRSLPGGWFAWSCGFRVGDS